MNKQETSLLIRNKKIVDCYTKEATSEEKALLEETERESELTKKWILDIAEQDVLKSKTISRDFQR
ncbi:hypothetical protein HMI54_013531 [Coelomomyces lativittatus]|nr:hypothetical protein HMI54_013531 [Coelomomyces lativittatus]